MKIIFFFLNRAMLFCIFFSAITHGYDLEGIWVEDQSLSIKGCEKIDDHSINCLEPKMAFSEGLAVVWQAKETCGSGSKEISTESYVFQFDYSILAEADSSVVVKSIEKASKAESVEIFRFINKNTFWIYYYGQENRDRFHKRIYYKRLTNSVKIKEAMTEFEGL